MRLRNILSLAAVSVVALAAPAFAAEGEVVATNWTGALAAFGLGVAAFGGAIGQAKIIAAAVESIARNPGAAGEIKGAWFLGLIFVETLVIYSLLIALIK